ncbi:hypothetical protein ACWD3D_10355, partial [Streptomyces sp. NPDC002690]
MTASIHPDAYPAPPPPVPPAPPQAAHRAGPPAGSGRAARLWRVPYSFRVVRLQRIGPATPQLHHDSPVGWESDS